MRLRMRRGGRFGEGKTNLPPQMSHPTPQNTAPTSNPMLCARMRNGPLNPANSSVTGLMIRPVMHYKIMHG